MTRDDPAPLEGIRPPRDDALARMSRVGKPPKSSFELAMERLRAADREAGAEETKLSGAQKEKIAEARRVATSRLAEREILFKDAMQSERAIEAVRRQAP